MRVYLKTFSLSIQDIFQYRLDFLLHTFKYAFMVILTALVWLAVEKESNSLLLNRQEIVSYFLYAAIFYSLSNFHTVYIEEDIKTGQFSKYLLKPFSEFWYFFTFQFAGVITEVVLKLIVMVPLFYVLGTSLSVSPVSLLIIFIFIPLIFTFSYNLLYTISLCAFWLTEIYAVRWSLLIIFRFLSGVFVPISFLPLWYQKFSFYLPFQHLIFSPIQVLQNKMTIPTAFSAICILLIWICVIVCIRRVIWIKGVRSYENVGV